MAGVSSSEPVSTTTISSTQGRTLSSAARSVRAESRTIMQSESVGRGIAASALDPVGILYRRCIGPARTY